MFSKEEKILPVSLFSDANIIPDSEIKLKFREFKQQFTPPRSGVQ